MNIDDLVNHISEWLRGTGANSDIVISSRIRLARNFPNIPFPHWADKEQEKIIVEKAKAIISQAPQLKDASFFMLSDLDNLDKQLLVERHLMSHEHAMRSNGKAICLTDNEVISIMINEEDHLRIQVMKSGFDLDDAWQIINKLDDDLSAKSAFAFSRELGFLTACPTNTGTGMRASIMLHLPVLVMTRQINRVLDAIAKLSFTTRGLYGEGTQASGNFFQISNQVSLGQKEEEIIDNLEGVISQVIDQEKTARDRLMVKNRSMLEDRIWRASGTLMNAHIITSQETVELLSMLRLGQDLGVINNLERQLINELFILTQPAHLQKIEKKKLTPQERDVKRAELIREKLTNKKL
ncbi:MAG: protein arginine kinase [Candidatus Omnitrophica bacterium]|nr:protein arginine kinase [Candidatus Omnitrophota bacterium]MDD5351927.1 protein arginine kinase [Candidatus Omnitrophota bacterium]MDD5550753.1 protein arginine kinase [Candidatus Omnitrophota bacterium]